MRKINMTDAREDLSSVVNEVAYGQERVVLTRRGRSLAAVVSIDDAKLLEQLEDELDLADAKAALADPDNADPVAWEQIKVNLGL